MIEIVHRKRVANGIEIGYRKNGHLMGIVFGDAEQMREFLASGTGTDDEELTVALRLAHSRSDGIANITAMKDKTVSVDYSKAVPIEFKARV